MTPVEVEDGWKRRNFLSIVFLIAKSILKKKLINFKETVMLRLWEI